MSTVHNSCVLSTALLIGAAAAAAYAQNQVQSQAHGSSTTKTVGDYFSDSDITAKVKTALLREKNLKSTDISVETTSGVVTLSGAVPSPAQIEQAVGVTRQVKGVKDVHDGLVVKSGT